MRHGILLLATILPLLAQDEPAVSFPFDDQVQSYLRRARATARDGDHERSVRMLETVLALPDSDETLVDVNRVLTLPCKTRARQILSELPAEALLYYLERNQAEAAEALESAAGAEEWRTLARRFPLTEAAGQAWLRLSAAALEQGAAQRALECAERACEALRDAAEATQLRGLCQQLLGLADAGSAAEQLRPAQAGSPQRWPGFKGGASGSWSAAWTPQRVALDTAWVRPQPNVLPRWIWQMLQQSEPPVWQPDEVEPWDAPSQSWHDAPLIQAVADQHALYLHDGRTASAIELPSGKLRWWRELDPEGDRGLEPRGTHRCALLGDAVAVLLGQERLVLLDPEDGQLLRNWQVAELARAAGIEAELRLFPVLLADAGRLYLLAGSIEPAGETWAICLDRHGELVWSRYLCAGDTAHYGSADLALAGGVLCVAVAEGGLMALEAGGGHWLWARTFAPQRAVSGVPGWGPFWGEEVKPQALPERDGPQLIVTADLLLLQRGPGGSVLGVELASGQTRWEAPASGEEARLLGCVSPTLFAQVDRLGLSLYQRSDGRMHERLAYELSGLEPDAVAGPGLAIDGGVALPLRDGLALLDLQGALQGRWSFAGEPARSVLAAGGQLVLLGPQHLVAFDTARTTAPASGDAIGDLLAESWRVRAATADSLRLHAQAADSLLVQLESAPQAELRWRARQLRYQITRDQKSAAWREALPADVLKELPNVVDGLTHENPAIRDLVCRRLGQASISKQLLPVFQALSEDPAAVVRITAAIERVRRGDRGGTAILVEALQNEAVERRRRASGALISFGQAEDWELLRPLLQDIDFDVRQRVTKKLLAEDMLDRSEVETLLADPAPSLAFLAFEALLRLGGARSEQLAALLEKDLPANADDPNRPPELIVATRLLAIKDRVAVAAVCSLTSHSNPRLRAWIQKKIFELAQDPERVFIPPESLLPLCESELANERFAALQTLARLGGDVAAEQLGRALDDEDWRIRKWAAGSALVPLEASSLAYLRGDTLPVRTRLMARLSGSPEQGCLEALGQGLRDRHQSIREQAANGLLRLRSPAVVPWLLERRIAGDARESAFLGKVLGRLPKTAMEDGLLLCLCTGDAALRTEARAELARRSGKTWQNLGVSGVADDAAAALWAAHFTTERRAALGLDGRLEQLSASNPNQRWQAAAELAELGSLAAVPEVLGALVNALETEKLPWLREQLFLSFAQLSGCSLEYAHQGDPETRAAQLQALRNWLQR